jgi:hypothetical protein
MGKEGERRRIQRIDYPPSSRRTTEMPPDRRCLFCHSRMPKFVLDQSEDRESIFSIRFNHGLHELDEFKNGRGTACRAQRLVHRGAHWESRGKLEEPTGLNSHETARTREAANEIGFSSPGIQNLKLGGRRRTNRRFFGAERTEAQRKKYRKRP